MQKNPESLKHASHNEEVCNYLTLKQEYSDWIITTAFYTALHFVSYEIFPFTLKGKEQDAKGIIIGSVFQYQHLLGLWRKSRHKITGDLCEKLCPEIASDYARLYDMSANARYTNYRQPIEVANKSRAILLMIKKYVLDK